MEQEEKAEKETLENLYKVVIAIYAATTTYHSAKERMCRTELAAQAAFLAGVFSGYSWISTHTHDLWLKGIALSVICVLCGLSWGHLQWQLKNRHSSALEVAAIQTALSEWLINPPLPNEMRVVNATGSEGMLPKCLDDKIREYKDCDNTRATYSELIMKTASVVLLLSIFIIFFRAAFFPGVDTPQGANATHSEASIKALSAVPPASRYYPCQAGKRGLLACSRKAG
jgi:hypothetical protein